MKPRRFGLALVGLVLLNLYLSSFLVSAGPLHEGQKQGRVSGLVFDVNDARVTGAKITFIRDPNMHEFVTDEEGHFDVQLPAGSYRFMITANGFCKFERDSLIITAGKTELVNVHLEVAVFDSFDACKCTSKKQR